MNISEAIAYLDGQVGDPKNGLPLDVFYFASRIVPMVNVDLLVKDAAGRVLLSWRDDKFAGAGWHVPGGIIRFKETITARIQKVALFELGAEVEFHPDPIAVNEVHCSHDTRGHFISLLYQCRMPDGYALKNNGRSETDPGYLRWHDACPENLVQVHEMYRALI